MEGTSVTLESGVPKIHRYDVIIWRCEHGDSVIAKMTFGIFATFDGADGRFRGTLELDYKTGSLTIRNIRTKHAGLYHLDITGNITLFKRINLSVYCEYFESFNGTTTILRSACFLRLIIYSITDNQKRKKAQTSIRNDGHIADLLISLSLQHRIGLCVL